MYNNLFVNRPGSKYVEEGYRVEHSAASLLSLLTFDLAYPWYKWGGQNNGNTCQYDTKQMNGSIIFTNGRLISGFLNI